MKEYSEHVKAMVYPDSSGLSDLEKKLLERASEVAARAYAPYSKFRVGTAVLLDNDEVVVGSNQENVAYPSGLCAERVALFSAGAQFPDAAVNTMAIIAGSDEFELEDVITPCGACRQVIMECQTRQNSPIRIILSSPNKKIIVIEDARVLLPFAFDASGLRS